MGHEGGQKAGLWGPTDGAKRAEEASWGLTDHSDSFELGKRYMLVRRASEMRPREMSCQPCSADWDSGYGIDCREVARLCRSCRRED